MEEDIKKLEELRQELERRREELKKELEKIETFLEAIESLIATKSFVTAAEIPMTKKPEEPVKPVPSTKPEEPSPQPSQPVEKEIPLRKDVLYIHRGRPVAWVEIYRNKTVVILDKDLGLPVDDSLITKFLEPRLRDEMVKDMQEIEAGVRPADKRFTYAIHDSDGIVVRIEMLDFGEEMRRRDNLSKIRWVIKKFIEKKTTQSQV